ncbi:MAG: ABC transporter permease [Mesorhizobium sp.]|uniref:ABC transporter permease n=2 Tax=Mesorhizobium TaxID=68287 RepID=UPI0007FFF511|nr:MULTISPECIES: ABC transporter permease [unclassified Mesorhizobium]WIE93562.1 ABC transporter permease [Mesorhizobium sp. WSM4875]OBQ92174.1 polyamine ABC transporter permease [Mesorhizobium sp. AA23]PBB36236.1 polyamine ABC transporter permease [Mesorhizobium sp. WSM3882]RUV05948.1 ABC transporter permease [Mesorhizobium sp. M1A.F.Ca.IN.020.03.2.1]RUV90328.1 ABC transporter permease [Mesorhizobium sp. M1A.F.Ca.IN.020.32.1.1]
MEMKTLTRVVLGLVSLLVAIWLVAPTLVVVPMSFNGNKSLSFPPQGFSWQWYENFVTNPEWSTSFLNSLKVASIVAVLATVLGTLAAFGLDRMKARPANLLRMLMLTPMVVPGVVLAIGIYAVYLDAQLVGTLPGFVLAHTILALPFVLIAVSANLEVFDRRLETAAASLGAGALTTFRTVTLPLILPGILSGLLFAFATSFDEIIVSLFITNPYLKTLPVQIFSSITRDADPTVAAVGTILLCATTILIGGGMLLLGRERKGRL